MDTKENQTHLEFTIPARGLIGLRTRMMNATRGEAVMPRRRVRWSDYLAPGSRGKLVTGPRAAAAPPAAPVAGNVTAINDRVAGEPGLVNGEPTGEGWLFKMKPADPAEIEGLLDQKAYDALTAAL